MTTKTSWGSNDVTDFVADEIIIDGSKEGRISSRRLTGMNAVLYENGSFTQLFLDSDILVTIFHILTVI